MMTPLMVLLAMIPGLYALASVTLSDQAALWGLRSLDVLTDFMAKPSFTATSADPAVLEPPLCVATSALVAATLSDWQPWALFLPSYLATVLLVFATFVLCRRLEGGRFAFWMVLLMSCHGPLLAQIQNASSPTLSLALAVLTFWAFIAHRQDADTLVSLKLLIGGITLGLCLLSGGPLAFVVVAILLLHVIGLRGESPALRSGRRRTRRKVWSGWPALKSLFVLVLTAFSVGGWWPLMLIWQYGANVTGIWLANGMPLGESSLIDVSQTELSSFSLRAGRRLLELQGGLAGLVLLGIWCVGRDMLRVEDERRRRRLQFLVAWLGCGLLVWVVLFRDQSVLPHSRSLWEPFVLIPSLAMAVVGIEEISKRCVSLPVVILLTGISMFGLFSDFIPLNDARGPILEPLALCGGSLFLLVLTAWLSRFFGHSVEYRRRWMLTGLILLQVAANAGAGLTSIDYTNVGDEALAACRRDFSKFPNVDRFILIHKSDSPTQVLYLLRSLWPRAEWSAAKGWDAARLDIQRGDFAGSGAAMVVDWSGRETRPTNIPLEGLAIRPVASQHLIFDLPLRLYEVIADAD
jgi:4-amino-4-deoxy-L-arabinose transferase-like glycosyltransferase